MKFSFAQSEQERIEIDVLRYESASVGQYHEDNWLKVKIRVRVGGFRGTVAAVFVTDELVKFAAKLRPMLKTLKGSAGFWTEEKQLAMLLTGAGKGHIKLCGEVADQRGGGTGNLLQFRLQLNRAQLHVSLRELEQVIARFPIRPTKRVTGLKVG